MKRARLSKLLCLALPFLAIFLGACEKAADERLIGYVEADYVHVALPDGGRLTALPVKRGDTVKAGQILFELDATLAEAALAAAEAELRQAESLLADMRLGQRPEELAIIQAQLEAAQASLMLSEPRVKRRRQLLKNNIVGEEDMDAAEASLLSDRGRAAEMSARLAAALLPQRPDAIRAQAEKVAAVRAKVRDARWRLSERKALAPVTGRIADIFYRQGEEVAAGRPVLQILAPDHVKLRLYVSERHLGAIRIGQILDIACDSCAAGLQARISFIADATEFTPPVIYSRDNRARLVFLIEAIPLSPSLDWHPGQPVEAALPAGTN